MNTLRGVLPAVVTPLNSEGRFVAAPFEQLLERLYARGIDGIYVCGQTGEGWAQSSAQRKTVAEVAVRNSPPGKQVVIHVGALSTLETVELARHAERIGAHAISSLPPAGGYAFEEIREFYRAVAGACGIPMLVYYFPSIATSIRTLDQILELCALPNVAGLKFTDMDLHKLTLIKRAGATIFNGSDEVFAAGMLMGADGGIGSTYNLIPHAYVEIYQAAQSGDWERARRRQRDVNEFIAALLNFPLHGAIKKLLTWNGIECGPCVAPRQPLPAGLEQRLRDEIAATALGRELIHN